MSNLEIREFSQAITKFVDESSLPEEVKRLALQEVLTRQEQRTRDALLAEIEARDAEEQEDEAGCRKRIILLFGKTLHLLTLR